MSRSEQPAHLPTSLERLAGFSVDCRCGRRHSVEMQGARVAPGARRLVVEWACRVGRRLPVCLVDDGRTHELAGREVGRLLERDGHRLRHCQLPDGAGGRPHADEHTLELVARALADCALAVAVGSGTVNDLTKLASFRAGIPYLVVATAPSMNGYTSAIAAITVSGLKRTVACHQPLAVLADLELITRAPAELVAAGLGDLESKPTATADFRLAGWLRDEYYCPEPERVVLEAEARVAEAAADIGAGDPQALAVLCEALLLSGISMKLAGTSAPASGAEHLISHFWDMTAPGEGRVEGWHGAQVGVATIVSATLYEKLRQVDPASIDGERLLRQRPDLAGDEQLRQTHQHWYQQARMELQAKTPGNEQLRRELDRLLSGWDELWRFLGDTMRPPERIRSILAAGGAPVTMSGLGLDADHLRGAFLAARQIRSRFTVLDLAAELGLLESLRDAVLAESGCLR